MPKKKEKYYAVDMLEVDSNHEHHNPILNFISKEKELENSFNECDVNKVLTPTSLKELLSGIDKKPMKFINGDAIFIEEISLSKKFKPSDKYFYRIDDYNENKATFGGFNETLDYVKKKVKNKYALVSYNGINEKIEFSEDAISNIITRMTANTHVIVINQLSIRGDESDSIMITPFKIM